MFLLQGCTVQQSFNGVVGYSMEFHAPAKTYTVYVTKGQWTTRLHGLGWEDFVRDTNHAHKGVVLLVFNIADQNPTISVAFIENANHEGHHEEDYESPAYCSKSSVQSDEDASCYILSPRVRPKTNENDRLVQLLPMAAADVGVPFVTRLTSTNLKRHDMVYIYICVSLCKVKFKKINFISSSMT